MIIKNFVLFLGRAALNAVRHLSNTSLINGNGTLNMSPDGKVMAAALPFGRSNAGDKEIER